jgi:hypothetical protein
MGIRALNPGDQVTLMFYVTAGGSVNANAGTQNTWLAIRRLGPV